MANKDARAKTRLHRAAKAGQTEKVQQLLLEGAEIDALDKNNSTPLCLATCYSREASSLALVAAGADVNVRDSREDELVVHMAARLWQVEFLTAVIECGADYVESIDSDQGTPFHSASLCHRVESIDMIVEAGSSIEARNRNGCTPTSSPWCYSSLWCRKFVGPIEPRCGCQRSKRQPSHTAALRSSSSRETRGR